MRIRGPLEGHFYSFCLYLQVSSWQINVCALSSGCLGQKGGVETEPPWLGTLRAIPHQLYGQTQETASVLAIPMLFIAGDQEPFHTG